MNKLKIMKTIHDPNLVFYADLAKHDGGLFMSDDAYGYKCTVTGATWGIQGRTFDGTDDFINCGSVLSGGLSQLTVGIWAKVDDATNYRALIGEDDTRNAPFAGFDLFTDNLNNIYFDVGNGTTYGRGQSTFVAGQMTFWVGTYNGATVTLYKNGIADISGSLTGTIATAATNTHISIPATSWGGGDIDMKGVVGEVLIYNRALIPLEIQNIYLATKWRYI